MKQKSPSTAPLMNNPGGFDHSPTDDNDNENNPHQLAPKIEVIDPWGIDQLLDNDNNVEVKLALHLVKKCVLMKKILINSAFISLYARNQQTIICAAKNKEYEW